MSICLNCTRMAEPGEEYCKYCLERLDEMVDNRDLSEIDRLDMRGNFNPFLSSASPTGRMSDDKSIMAAIDREEGSTENYWTVVLIVIFLIILLMVIYL